MGRVRRLPRRSDGRYGAPRLWKDLRELAGQPVGQTRGARLMRVAGLVGVSRRRVGPTQGGPVETPAADRVRRNLTATAPNQLWVADIPYVPTWAGFLLLAIVPDVYSRRILGWAMATHLRTELVLQALHMAVEQRRPRGVIHPSDRGCQYTALAFGQRCQEMGVRPSRGAVGSTCDNAMMPSPTAV